VIVSRRRFAVLATVLVAVNVFFWLAQSGFALPAGGGLIQTLLGGRLIRAEVLWLSPDGKVQDTRLDRGVVVSVTSGSIVLREKDASQQTIPLAANVTVRGLVQSGTIANLRRGMRVVVAREANAPADTVQVEGFGGG
jgi:hypothetical protein